MGGRDAASSAEDVHTALTSAQEGTWISVPSRPTARAVGGGHPFFAGLAMQDCIQRVEETCRKL